MTLPHENKPRYVAKRFFEAHCARCNEILLVGPRDSVACVVDNARVAHLVCLPCSLTREDDDLEPGKAGMGLARIDQDGHVHFEVPQK